MGGKKRTDHSVRETAVIYVTKYALSAGVWKIRAEIAMFFGFLHTPCVLR